MRRRLKAVCASRQAEGFDQFFFFRIPLSFESSGLFTGKNMSNCRQRRFVALSASSLVLLQRGCFPSCVVFFCCDAASSAFWCWKSRSSAALTWLLPAAPCFSPLLFSLLSSLRSVAHPVLLCRSLSRQVCNLLFNFFSRPLPSFLSNSLSSLLA